MIIVLSAEALFCVIFFSEVLVLVSPFQEPRKNKNQDQDQKVCEHQDQKVKDAMKGWVEND